MKPIVTAILCAAFINATRSPAADVGPWKPVPLPAAAAGLHLRSIYFVDDQHGWIVGDKGLCLATTDGGKTWEKRDTGSDATLRCVRFTDARTGFACGDGDSRAPAARGHVVMGRPQKQGTLLSTTDGGATWKPAWVPCNFEIWCVEAATAPKLQVGIGLDEHLDGDITRSADGGATWTERRVFRALADIRAVNATRWVAVGSPVSVGFFGGEIKDPAFVAKECRALFSDDAGGTWNVSAGSDGGAVLRGLLARRGLPLVAIGDDGALLASDDDGEHWRSVPPPARVQWRGIAADAGAERPTVIVAVGDRGAFLLSTDAGRTWRASAAGPAESLHAVAACGSRFFAVGAGGTALACTADDLAAARDLPPAPTPPVAERGPVPKATAEQRARFHVGDFMLVTYAMRGPKALGLNFEWQVKTSITAMTEDTVTLVHEVVKGQPPPGAGSRREEAEVPIAMLADDEAELHRGMKVGESREEPAGLDEKTKQQISREPDEAMEVNGTRLECVVVKTVIDVPGVGKVESKTWCCPDRVPFGGVVKSESTQPIGLPGVAAAVMTSTQMLTDWKSGTD